MKLYLTSYRIPDLQVLTDLVGKMPDKTKMALIPNAKDYYAPRARAVKIRLVQTALSTHGYKATVVDLNEYKSAAKLKKDLLQYDLLWCMGGNSFCLREAMARSGFDHIIHDILGQGITYAGESAGACVAGCDLHGVEMADDPEFAERVIWKGLDLSPHFFLPHADNAEFMPFTQAVVDRRGTDPKTMALNDNQAWVVNGDDAWKVTGIELKPQAT